MLDAETREGIRRAAESLSSLMSDDRRETMAQGAHRIIDSFRSMGMDDDSAANAAYLVAALFATLNSSPVRSLAELVEGTMDAHMLAAGSLAGVYALPERKAEEGEEPSSEPVPAVAPATAPSGDYGGYL